MKEIPLTDISPDWLGPYIHQVLDTGPDTYGSGRLTHVDLNFDGDPLQLLAASHKGLVLVTYGDDHPDVRFVPWREVRAISVQDCEVTVALADPRASMTVDFTDDEDKEQPEKARRFAVDLIRLMPTKAR